MRTRVRSAPPMTLAGSGDPDAAGGRRAGRELPRAVPPPPALTDILSLEAALGAAGARTAQFQAFRSEGRGAQHVDRTAVAYGEEVGGALEEMRRRARRRADARVVGPRVVGPRVRGRPGRGRRRF